MAAEFRLTRWRLLLTLLTSCQHEAPTATESTTLPATSTPISSSNVGDTPSAPRRGAGEKLLLYHLDERGSPKVPAHLFSTLEDDERAALAFVSATVGNGCDPHLGKNLRPTKQCVLTAALGVEEQCGPDHHALVARWFSEEQLSYGCEWIPSSAFVRTALARLWLTAYPDRLVVEYEAIGTEGPGAHLEPPSAARASLLGGSARSTELVTALGRKPLAEIL